MNKILRFILACLFLFNPIVGEPSMDRQYELDKGLNNTTNGVLLLDGESTVSSNVYYKDKKVLKRPGLDLVSTHAYKVFDLEGVPINVRGVMGAKDWEAYFLDVDATTDYFEFKTTITGYNYRINSDTTTTNFSRSTIDLTQTVYPSSYVYYTVGTQTYSYIPTTNMPKNEDCAIINNSLYCASSLNTNPPEAFKNVKANFSESGNMLDSMDAITGWSAINTSTTPIGTITSNSSSTSFVEGSGSVYFDGTSTSGGTLPPWLGIQKTVNWDLDDYEQWYMSVWLYLGGAAEYPKTIYMMLSTAGLATDYKAYKLLDRTGTWSGGGRGYVLIDLDSTQTTKGSTDMSNITVVAFVADTTAGDMLSGGAIIDALTLFPKFNDSGVLAPTLSITTTPGAATGLTGTYYYKCSCTDWNGAEGNASGTSAAVTVSNKKITVTLPAGICDNKKYINLYRNKNGGSVYYLVTTTGASTTTYTDSVADSSLITIYPYAGSSTNDNGKVNPVKYIEYYKDRLWSAGDKLNSSRLFYSDLLEPDSFPTNNFIDIGFDDGQSITGLKSVDAGLLIFKPYSIYLLSGDSPDTFEVSQVADWVGTRNNRSIINVNNVIYFLGEGRFWAYDGEKLTGVSSQIESSISGYGLSENKVFGAYFPTHNQIWWVFPSTASYAEDLGGVDVWVLGLDSGAWTQYDFEDYYQMDTCDPLSILDLKYIKESNQSLTVPYRMVLASEYSPYPVYRYNLDASGSVTTSDESCSIDSHWESKYYFQPENSGPSGEKIYDFFYVLTDDVTSTGTVSSYWSFDYTDTTSFSQTITVTPGSSDEKIKSNKVFLSGASGNNRSIKVGFTDDSSTDYFGILGFEIHYLPTGGER